MRTRALLARRAALLGGLPLALTAAAAADPFIGTWRLDPARSHYAQHASPLRMTLVIQPAPNGIEYRSDTLYAGGRAASSYYVANFDGTPALVVGTTGFLAPISLTRVGEAAIDAVYTSGRKKVAWSHWSAGANGTELVIDTTYLGKQGEEIKNLAVFHRAEP